jgi:hypothetical protein
MKGSKYKRLEADYNFATKELEQRRKMIEQLRKEREQAYHEGHKQGRVDEHMNAFMKPEVIE